MYVPSADYIQEKDHSLFSTLPSSQMLIDRIALQGVKCNTDLSKIVFNKYSYELFDYPPVRVPTGMNQLKKSFLYHPKVDEYVHLPVRMRNPGSWNNLISVFRLIFAMTRVCDIVCKGIEISQKKELSQAQGVRLLHIHWFLLSFLLHRIWILLRMFNRPSFISVIDRIKVTSNFYVLYEDYIQDKNHFMFLNMNSVALAKERIAL